MPIPFQDLEVVVISPAIEKTRSRGETHQLIVAPTTNPRDHWYANFYPTGNDGFDVETHLFVNKGDIIEISGNIRKYPIDKAFGVVLDISEAWNPKDEVENTNQKEHEHK